MTLLMQEIMGLFSVPDSASTSKTHLIYLFALANIISREHVCQLTPFINLIPADVIVTQDILIKCQLYAVARSIGDVGPYYTGPGNIHAKSKLRHLFLDCRRQQILIRNYKKWSVYISS